MQISRKNLDEFYSTIKSEVGKLQVYGWDAREKKVIFGYPTAELWGDKLPQTLLEFFFQNWKEIKEGVGTLVIATAMPTETPEYSWDSDDLKLSTQVTNQGLLCTLTRSQFSEQGAGLHDGSYKLERLEDHCVTFLVQIEKEEEVQGFEVIENNFDVSPKRLQRMYEVASLRVYCDGQFAAIPDVLSIPGHTFTVEKDPDANVITATFINYRGEDSVIMKFPQFPNKWKLS